MELDSKIYVAGHRGLVGSAIVRELDRQGYTNIITATKSELDLTNQNEVKIFFKDEKPEYVFDAAAKVGGIYANDKHSAEFIYENIQIQSNLIHYSYLNNIKKFLFLGSSCVYPKFSQQPIKEEYLLSGYLEPTNEAYAIAKISGIEMCKSYKKQYGFNAISCMPTNIYGINDNFNLTTSHVIPALIRKFIEAKNINSKNVVLWGDGLPQREFLYCDDLADACIFLMNNYNDSMPINIGSNEEYTIAKIAQLISELINFKGVIDWDKNYPNGTPRKKLDNSKIFSLGWKPKTNIKNGLEKTIEWFINNE